MLFIDTRPRLRRYSRAMRVTILRLLILVPIATAAACGGGMGDDAPGDDSVEPVLVPGGGVTGAAIDGTVNVFVIDRDSGEPIAGATVQIGELVAHSNTLGLAIFDDAALAGLVTVTVTASGMVTTTWIGVVGTSATVPLEAATPPQAEVTGTISGWDQLPSPSLGNYNLGVVLYGITDDVGARENHLTQAAPGGIPANTCIKSAVSNSCAWQLNTRVGRQVLFAVIVEGDPQGTTSDPSDDTYTLIGYASSGSMTLAAGQSVTNQSLVITPTNARSPLTVGFPAAPAGLGDLLALPMLDLGDDGRLVFALPPVTPGRATAQVLTPSGPFAGSYDLVGIATPSGAATMPYSTGFARGATVGTTTQLPAWLPAPTQVSATAGTYSFAGADTAVRYATFSRGATRLWNVSLFDRSTSFTLPSLPENPLGTGTVTLEITAADLTEFDAGHFSVPGLTAALSRASGATTTFTP
jgi:hypothetical protein